MLFGYEKRVISSQSPWTKTKGNSLREVIFHWKETNEGEIGNPDWIQCSVLFYFMKKRTKYFETSKQLA